RPQETHARRRGNPVSQFGAETSTVLDGSQFDAGILRPTVLAFLNTILASGAKPVDDLQTMACSAGLLSERQRISDAKLFKWAKRTLRIRSVRIGYGSAGHWCWVLSHDPGSDVAEPAGHLSMDPPPAVIPHADFSSAGTTAANTAELK